MSMQILGVGTTANDGTGDPLRTNLIKVNANFAQLGAFTPIRTVTAAGDVTVLATDGVVRVKKTTGQATTVTLEASPVAGATHIVKDGKGDAGTNPITIRAASGTIDGAASVVIGNGYDSVTLVYNGDEWGIV